MNYMNIIVRSRLVLKYEHAYITSLTFHQRVSIILERKKKTFSIDKNKYTSSNIRVDGWI